MWIQNGKPAVVLAPMEGVTDAPMRALLTETGGYSHCVSEFIRISHTLLPDKVYLRYVPELVQGGVTPSGIPVQVQLLGGDAERLSLSALQAIRLGAKGIDINFGCPAPTVNRHDGGATLLKYPSRLYQIVKAVRDAVPKEFPVSAKVRLGWDTTDAIFENAQRIQEAGAAWITIHARTKAQGYTPTVHWDVIGKVREQLAIPVIANGEIWSLDDYRRCRAETGCEHFMLGRGALGDPNLANSILADKENPFLDDKQIWFELLTRFRSFAEPYADMPGYTPRRIKQWLNIVNRKRPLPWFESVKRASSLSEVFSSLS